MGEYWNTALTARMVIETCQAQAVDPQPILLAAALDQATIDDPEGRVSLDQMRRFWQEAVIQSNDPAIGLHAGMRAPDGLYGLLDYIMNYSPTIGAALTRFGEYLPLVNNWAALRVEDDGDPVYAITEAVWGAVPRTTAEYIAAAVIGRSRMVWGNGWAPDLVRFEFAEPAAFETRGEHARVLGCPVEFGAPRTEFVISRTTWDQGVRTADPGLVALLEERADQVLARLPRASTLAEDVRREIRASMAGGDQRVDTIADQLGTSPRTLQRNLAKDGLSFAAIVDEVRLETAKIAMADRTMSLAQIAYFVGFEEQSSFSRAFKRWTGTSPKDYRHSLAVGVESDWPDEIDLPPTT